MDEQQERRMIAAFANETAESGALLSALCGIVDERGETLVIRRSPRGAVVVFIGEPERYVAEDADETLALRKAVEKLEGRA